MDKNNWNPGHSLNKGYPYAGVESEKQLPSRIKIILEKDNVITVDFASFGEPLNESKAQLDFMISRAFDFQEALRTAEQQVKELLNEDPFLPEDLGFELVHKPESIHDSPVRMFASKYDPRFTLYREIADPNDPNWDTTKWVLMKKNDDFSEKFDKIHVKIPCYRIAYALFYAMGVVMEEEQHEGNEAPVTEEKPTPIYSEAERIAEEGAMEAEEIIFIEQKERREDEIATIEYNEHSVTEDIEKVLKKIKETHLDNYARFHNIIKWFNWPKALEDVRPEWYKYPELRNPKFIEAGYKIVRFLELSEY